MKRLIYFGVLAFGLWTGVGMAQNGPLRIEITDGVIEPLTFAVPMFEAENIINRQFTSFNCQNIGIYSLAINPIPNQKI